MTSTIVPLPFLRHSVSLQKQKEADSHDSDMFTKVDDWDNSMADQYMTLQQEVEAFGEKMPEPQYNKASAKTEADADFEKECA